MSPWRISLGKVLAEKLAVVAKRSGPRRRSRQAAASRAPESRVVVLAALSLL